MNIFEVFDWINANLLWCWLISYVIILLIFQLLSWRIIRSWTFGTLLGVTVVNGVSIVYATLVTGTQPLWMTFCIFIFSLVIVGLIISNHQVEKPKSKEAKYYE
jgi:hypothetical protein